MNNLQNKFVETLPSDWRLCRLKAVANIRYGLGQPPSELTTGVAMIRATDVDAGSIRTNNLLRVNPAELPKDRNPYLKTDEIIVVRSGAYTGDSAIVPFALEGSVAGYDMVATVTRASAQFVAHSLLSKYVLEDQIHTLTLRAAQPHLNAEELGSIVLALPSSRREQERIAAYLDKTCAAIDTVIEKKQKQLETLDALRKSIIHKAVTRGLDDSEELKDSGVDYLGRIPKHWRHDHLKRVCVRIQTGTTPPTANTEYYVDGTIPWYTPGCYNGDLYLEESSKLINDLAYQDNKLRLFPAESIFLIGIGATIGKVAMTKTEASCNQQITAIVCNSEVSSKYMTYQMKIYEGIIPKISQYTTLPIMDQVKMGYLRVTIPSTIEEQKLIADYLDAKTAELQELTQNITDQIRTLEQYRKSLIHECVTGKRRITEEDLKEHHA